ncbi:MAG: polysaccharide deacetylase family protein, partial [Thermomicrobiaceae bacterium]|nr:polysaccharide deacetylase family protein [Thermomicrobiaceae bacterium]
MLRVVVLVLLAALLAVPGASRPAQAAGVRTIRQFDTADRVVALTFDAGADRGYAPGILDTLAAKGVKASFGMTGVWASQNPDLVQRMVREGHSLINHTWDHRSFTGRSTGTAPLSSAERALELSRTADLVFAQTGVRLAPYFRPPYGDYDDSVVADLAASGYTLNIMWTIDSLGWNGLSAPAIERRVVDNIAPGAIVLMHVGAQSADALALSAVIDDLRARGYRFASVADLVGGSPRPSSRLFPQTGHVVRDRFLYFWEDFGGLEVFGYPLTDAATDPVSGLTVQTFERARFELHPGAAPAHDDVLLGLLVTAPTRDR